MRAESTREVASCKAVLGRARLPGDVSPARPRTSVIDPHSFHDPHPLERRADIYREHREVRACDVVHQEKPPTVRRPGRN